MKSKEKMFSIAGRYIGSDQVPYCIAEVGINHNGDISIAKKMIDAAKAAGADAVKFQTFKAAEFCGDPEQNFTYKSQGKEVTESMLKMFERYELSDHEWQEIKNYCDLTGVVFFSTPQNESDLKLLMNLGVPAVKIGSDDFTNLPLIHSFSKANLPVILSCGMSDLGEVYQALEAANWFNGAEVALMLCTSQYPTPPCDVNINKLATLRSSFPGLLVGFSDHTQGSLAASLATAMGARIFEKHMTLDHNLPGPDHWFSDDPSEIAVWVESIKTASIMMGTHLIRPTFAEKTMRLMARRSIVALFDIAEGEMLSKSNIGLRRPGDGMPPNLLNQVIGLVAARNIFKGEKLALGDMVK